MRRLDGRSISSSPSIKNRWVLSCLLLALAIALAQLAASPLLSDAAAPGADVHHLSDERIDESSGLARSHRVRQCFWTHNDSGDSARLFAFAEQGGATGGCTLAGVVATDFEEVASYVQDGIPRLLVADVGDNRSRRPFVSLYFFDEPDPQTHSEVTNWFRLDVRYPNGPRDCEAVAVDVSAGKVILVSKSFLPRALIYEIDLPAHQASNDMRAETARLVGQLPLSLVTAMDFDQTTGDVLLVNYFQLFRFAKPEQQRNWWDQTPRATDLPKLRQIEAVAVDHTGGVWVTSEGNPAPLARVDEAIQEADAR